MKILVQVEVEVDGATDSIKNVDKVEISVKEAIRECLERGEDMGFMGFNHPLSNKLSLSIGRIRAVAVQE